MGIHTKARCAIHGVLCGVSAVLVAAMGAGCGPQEEGSAPEISRPVAMITIDEPSAVWERTFPGQVRAATQSELSFRVSGTLLEIPVDEGKRVKQGDVLARLDRRDFETRLADARSALAAGTAELDALRAGTRPEDIASLEAQVNAAQARRDQAQADFDRQRQLFDEGLAPRSDFEKSETTLTIALQDAEKASQELSKARNGARPEDVEAAEARVEGLRARVQEAEAALTDTTLRAPFDGVIAVVHADAFQEMQAKQTMVTMQDLAGLEVTLQVPESLVLVRQAGITPVILVSFAGRPDEEYAAEIRALSTKADPSTQTYALTLALPAPEGLTVLPGMTAQARIRAEAAEGAAGAVRVPIQAVGSDAAGNPYVWVIDSGTMRAARRSVRTGELRGDAIEIVEGLTSGERVAAAGVYSLQEGQLVRPLEN